MRRRLPVHARFHVHAEALAHDHAGDGHDSLPTLMDWQRALEDDEATRHSLQGQLRDEPDAIAAQAPTLTLSGVIDESCFADPTDANPLVVAANPARSGR